ncbi:MAG: hypothetical protein ABIX37_07545 [Gammaproteobacteria bacterium]
MNLATRRGVPCLPVAYALSLSLLAGCAQLTTSSSDRASLKAAADAAGQAYLDCLGQSAGRYVGTTEDVRAIRTLAQKNCADTRATASRAQAKLQDTSYIMSAPQVEAALKALDDQGEAAITDQVLNRRAAAPAVAVGAVVPAAVPAAERATPMRAGGDDYLACMRSQGERWAATQEPATVIADAAHNRCASSLAGSSSAATIEQQGRALVLGLVLDRKSPPPKP